MMIDVMGMNWGGVALGLYKLKKAGNLPTLFSL